PYALRGIRLRGWPGRQRHDVRLPRADPGGQSTARPYRPARKRRRAGAGRRAWRRRGRDPAGCAGHRERLVPGLARAREGVAADRRACLAGVAARPHRFPIRRRQTMDFRIEAQLPATAAQLWAVFFDVHRVAGLIPGCEAVEEVEPLKAYSAVMKQRIGIFKLEVPTRITV